MKMNIKEAVAERIASSGEEISRRVVDFLAEATIAKRAKMVTDAIIEVDNLTKDLKRLKPDLTAYNQDGTVASQNWSKKAADDHARLSGRIAKVTKAIDSALAGNFNDIGNLGGNTKLEASDENPE
jgi:DNA-binding ferritin-like protein